MRQDTTGCLAGAVGLHVGVLRATTVGEGRFHRGSIGNGDFAVAYGWRTRRRRVISVQMRRRGTGLIC